MKDGCALAKRKRRPQPDAGRDLLEALPEVAVDKLFVLGACGFLGQGRLASPFRRARFRTFGRLFNRCFGCRLFGVQGLLHGIGCAAPVHRFVRLRRAFSRPNDALNEALMTVLGLAMMKAPTEAPTIMMNSTG